MGRPDPSKVAWQVPVHYATNQRFAGWKQGKATFAPGRDVLRFGRALVSIPFKHKLGEIETPSLFFFPERPADHFVMAASSTMNVRTWFKGIQAEASRHGRKQMLVFVHGYNVPFQDALFRTAQISWDVKFAGPSVMFAWPSGARMRRYSADEAAAQAAQADLTRTLVGLLRRTSIDEFYLIAHSMGNRVLTEALLEIERTMPSARARIKEVILAAPDIDAQYFRSSIAPRLPKIAQGLTIYASSEDKALLLSSRIHGYRRVGHTRDGITIVPRINTIDATGLGDDFLRHAVFADAPPAIMDMKRIIDDDSSPDARGLIRQNRPGLHWRFRPRIR